MTKKSKYCWSDENNPLSGIVSLAETVIPSLTHQILDRINTAGLCEAAELLTGVVTGILSFQFIHFRDRYRMRDREKRGKDTYISYVITMRQLILLLSVCSVTPI